MICRGCEKKKKYFVSFYNFLFVNEMVYFCGQIELVPFIKRCI